MIHFVILVPQFNIFNSIHFKYILKGKQIVWLKKRYNLVLTSLKQILQTVLSPSVT